MQNQSHRCVLLGFGYTAAYLVQAAGDAPVDWLGTTRDIDKQQSITIPLILPDDSGLIEQLNQADSIVISAPPGDGQRWALDRCQSMNRSTQPVMVYLSSTGVYGDHAGAWVDETSMLNTQDERAIDRLQAEREWQSFADDYGYPLYILRLAGIYGPARNMVERLLAGDTRYIVKPDHYFSRVHVADIAQTILVAMHQPQQAGIYNLADDEPTAGYVVTEYAASLLNLPLSDAIPFEQAVLSPMMARFYAANRRVANHKLKAKLGIKLAYPTYRHGLQAVVNHLGV